MSFKIFDTNNAPAAARPVLDAVRSKYGMIPNVLGVMAANPATLQAYTTLSDIFAKTGFSAVEQHVVLQSVNAANGCHYCTKAHGTVAVGGRVVSADLDLRLRQDKALEDARLEALRVFTQLVVRKQGFVADSDLAAFRAAGFGDAEVLAVILGAGFKLISNYVNHIAHTPVDSAFASFAEAA